MFTNETDFTSASSTANNPIVHTLIDYATWPAHGEDERRATCLLLRNALPYGDAHMPAFIEAYNALICDYFKVELCDLFSRLGRREFLFHTKWLLNTSTSPHVRFHAAIALARLGFQQGFDFLEKEFMRNLSNIYDAEVIPEGAILSALRRSILGSRAIKLAQRLEMLQRTGYS